MKKTRRFTAISSVILTCVISCSLLLLTTGSSFALVNPASDLSKKLSYKIPANPKLDYPTNNERDFGNFAWQTFVALNWPASCEGSPLTDKTIGTHDTDKSAPRVWEFYHHPEDVFLPGGEKPPLEIPKPYKCPPIPANNGKLTYEKPILRQYRLTELAADPIVEELGLDSHLQLMEKKDLCLSESIQPTICLAGGYVLVDSSRNYVINEARMNPAEVDQIFRNKWYSAEKLKRENFNNAKQKQRFVPNLFQLLCSSKEPDGKYPDSKNLMAPCKENGTKPDDPTLKDNSMGAIEIKAAWMILEPEDPEDPKPEKLFPDRKKYYTTKLSLLVTTTKGEHKSKTVDVALIGFHIVQKTSKQGWIWSTFEQVDNAPLDKKSASGKYYNLYKPDCQNSGSECTENQPAPATSSYLWRKQFPYAVTKEDTPQTPSQITRQVTIPTEIKELNKKWQAKLTGVWKNYQLIGVQWLANPNIPYDGGVITPNQLLNTALEPFPEKMQKALSNANQSSNVSYSCIGCHQNATLPYDNSSVYSDFSFMMNDAK